MFVEAVSLLSSLLIIVVAWALVYVVGDLVMQQLVAEQAQRAYKPFLQLLVLLGGCYSVFKVVFPGDAAKLTQAVANEVAAEEADVSMVVEPASSEAEQAVSSLVGDDAVVAQDKKKDDVDTTAAEGSDQKTAKMSSSLREEIIPIKDTKVEQEDESKPSVSDESDDDDDPEDDV